MTTCSSPFCTRLLTLALVSALAGCSSHHANTPKQTAPTAPAASAVQQPHPKIPPKPLDPAAAYVSAFGKGELTIVKRKPGPDGTIAVLVAPTGTKKITPTTPCALLWILPDGKYAINGTLLGRDGQNLSLKFKESMGLIPPQIISMPVAPPVSAPTTAVGTSSHPIGTSATAAAESEHPAGVSAPPADTRQAKK